MNDRHIKWILLASLLVNALVIGFFAGRVGRGGFNPPMMAALRGPGGGPGPGEMGPGPMGPGQMGPEPMGPGQQGPGQQGLGNVDRAAVAVVRAALQAERPAMDKALADLAAARGKSAALIRAESLNPAELDKSLEQMRASSLEVLTSFHRSIAAAAAKLDPTQRAALARYLMGAQQGRNGAMGALGPPAAPRDMLRERQIERLQGRPQDRRQGRQGPQGLGPNPPPPPPE